MVAAHAKEPTADIGDRLLVAFGVETLKIVPGRVSTEVDARLSFDIAGTITRAHRILKGHEEAGIDRSRTFVKMAATWEGTQAARQLAEEAANAGANDPGVKSVVQIYRYYKQHGIPTEVMGANFRNIGQILALAGCDLMTIRPALLAELSASKAPVQQALDARAAAQAPMERLRLDESAFRLALNQDAMATEKMAEGIRQFVIDAIALELIAEIKAAGR